MNEIPYSVPTVIKWGPNPTKRQPSDIDRIVKAFRNFLETNYVSGESEGGLLGLKSIEIVHDEGFDTITLNIKDYDYETEEEDSE